MTDIERKGEKQERGAGNPRDCCRCKGGHRRERNRIGCGRKAVSPIVKTERPVTSISANMCPHLDLSQENYCLTEYHREIMRFVVSSVAMPAKALGEDMLINFMKSVKG